VAFQQAVSIGSADATGIDADQTRQQLSYSKVDEAQFTGAVSGD
jgi:hypothetical protein